MQAALTTIRMHEACARTLRKRFVARAGLARAGSSGSYHSLASRAALLATQGVNRKFLSALALWCASYGGPMARSSEEAGTHGTWHMAGIYTPCWTLICVHPRLHHAARCTAALTATSCAIQVVWNTSSTLASMRTHCTMDPLPAFAGQEVCSSALGAMALLLLCTRNENGRCARELLPLTAR